MFFKCAIADSCGTTTFFLLLNYLEAALSKSDCFLTVY